MDKAKSLIQVNKELHKTHPKIDLVRGEGYFYISSFDEEVGLMLAGLYTTSIPVYSIKHQSVDRWLQDIETLLELKD